MNDDWAAKSDARRQTARSCTASPSPSIPRGDPLSGDSVGRRIPRALRRRETSRTVSDTLTAVAPGISHVAAEADVPLSRRWLPPTRHDHRGGDLQVRVSPRNIRICRRDDRRWLCQAATSEPRSRERGAAVGVLVNALLAFGRERSRHECGSGSLSPLSAGGRRLRDE